MNQNRTTVAFKPHPKCKERTIRSGKLIGLSFAALLTISFLVDTSSAQTTKETVDVVGQGAAGPIVSADGAKLWRSDTGLTASLGMPTPVPGSYVYPPPNAFQPEVFPGHPEVFTLWMFVFNFPDECLADPCDSADFAARRGMSGAFNVAGHPVGGSNLQLSGRVTMNTTPFVGNPLLEPRTAEVHLAVAPHGALQPDLMPTQITTPIGTSAHWWLAFFLPD